MTINKVKGASLLGALIVFTLMGCGSNPQQSNPQGKLGVLELVETSASIPSLTKDRSSLLEISVRNKGGSDVSAYPVLEDVPDRLHIQGGALSTQRCTTGKDSECGTGNVACLGNQCFSYLNNTDHQRKRIPKDGEEKWQIIISGGPVDLGCKPAPQDVPDKFKKHYCGKVKVYGGASTSPMTMYLQYEGPSGAPTLSNYRVKFQDVVFGKKMEETITLTNEGQTPLKVKGLSFTDTKDNQFGVDASSAFTLNASEKKEITISFEMNKSNSSKLLNLATVLKIDSEGHPAEEIHVTATSKSDRPYLSPTIPTLFNFEAATNERTFTISNKGDENSNALTVSKTITMASNVGVADYTFKNNNNENIFDKDSKRILVVPGSDFNVKVNGPTANPTDAFAILKLISNGFPTDYDIILVGQNSEGPYGRIYPHSKQNLLLSKQDQKVRLVIRNMGTADLVVKEPTYSHTSLTLQDLAGNDINFPLTIPKESYKIIQLKVKDFTTLNDTEKITFNKDPNDYSQKFVKIVDPHAFANSTGPTSITIKKKENNTLPEISINEFATSVPLGASVFLQANTTEGQCSWFSAGKPDQDHSFITKEAPCAEGFLFHPTMLGDYSFFVRKTTQDYMVDSDIATFTVTN